jgi:beta-lactamase superfamily II metal-dependent hydrolase
LGAQTGDLNDYSLVQLLQYGSFDVLFTGDADDHVEHYYTGMQIGSRPIEILKVPHHGSKTGMMDNFISWVHPNIAIISVGKNTYGHPSKTAIDLLSKELAKVYRTDQSGDIEIISDGSDFIVKTQNNK